MMDMKSFSAYTPNKFLVVLSKMQASVFEIVNKRVKSLGYNRTEFQIMYTIAAHGAMTIQHIAERISVTSGNMTYTLDKLENRGIIQRVICPEDGRKMYIDFTQTGQEAWTVLMHDLEGLLGEMFQGIDEALLQQTIEHMKIIGKHVV